jgi:hypothetical protein
MRIARCSALTEGYEYLKKYIKKSCLFLFHDEFSFFFSRKKNSKKEKEIDSSLNTLEQYR